jgi:tRNA pseudouridine55 synthase
MEDQIILLDKPAGISSFGVVARVRGNLRQQFGKKVKVGHTGTLDPFATGLMIIVTGKECKNAQNYSKLDKTYEATIRLGNNSSTGDPEGEISHISDHQPNQEEVLEALQTFVGKIMQKPPIYSAIKVDGRRAYHLAREGKTPDIPAREVEIYSIELIDYSYPELKFIVHVSSGTYIRTLAEDIGKKLKTGAFCQELRRTAVSKWSVEDAYDLEHFAKKA